jgi:hypothetical protein
VVLKRLMALRRAFADEYAVRVNRAVVLLGDRSAADAVRALRSMRGWAGSSPALRSSATQTM